MWSLPGGWVPPPWEGGGWRRGEARRGVAAKSTEPLAGRRCPPPCIFSVAGRNPHPLAAAGTVGGCGKRGRRVEGSVFQGLGERGAGGGRVSTGRPRPEPAGRVEVRPSSSFR